jgi:hypothetical protein
MIEPPTGEAGTVVQAACKSDGKKEKAEDNSYAVWDNAGGQRRPPVGKMYPPDGRDVPP